jgi:hypothetical protein
LGNYDHGGLSEVQLAAFEEASREMDEVFSCLRQTTDRAQATILLFHNLPDRMDLLEQGLQELYRVCSIVEELVALMQKLRSIVQEVQGMIEDPSSVDST